jgi:hypothetical protein
MERRSGRLGCLLAIPVFIVTAIVVYAVMVYPWISRWGATDLETADRYPGDELVSEPRFRTTRAVTVNAAPEKIWPWLLQLGVDRGGMYSYDWLENLFGLKVHSADRIVEEWQDLQPGGFIRLTPPDYAIQPGPGLYVTEMDAPNALIGCFGMEGQPPAACPQSWQFLLQPASGGSTRLILRTHTAAPGILPAAFGKAFQFPVWIMEQGMLRGIKARAER